MIVTPMTGAVGKRLRNRAPSLLLFSEWVKQHRSALLELNAPQFEAQGLRYKLTPGMQVSAEIIRHHQSSNPYV